MSDDLVKRLGTPLKEATVQQIFTEREEAKKRIEELEANLAKAVGALGEAIYLLDPDEEDIAKKTGLHRIVTTYAELTGGNDE